MDDLRSGVAGASAQREYERRKSLRDERVRNRFGRRVGNALLAVAGEPQSITAWKRGAEGESDLAVALSDVEDIGLLHDRNVRGTRANIDHIAIAPAGIFVIDAKYYEGTIRVRDVGGFFHRDERLYVGAHDRSKLAEAMASQVAAVKKALIAAGIDDLPPVVPVLCFVHGSWPLTGAPNDFRGVRIEGMRSIKTHLRASGILGPAEIDRIYAVLARAFPPN